ncbi:MAG: SDR family oxidoreductase [Flavobacteriales bacterium]|jgi:dehydrogenase/reductase SDR family protein 7B
MNQNFYKDQVIWITGASSGIGEALAVELAAKGARLILSARREDELHRVNQLCGGKGTIIKMDLGDEKSIHEAATEVFNLYPNIDFLFNNGGISQRSLCLDTDISVDRRIMEVNFFGNILLSKLVGKKMLTAKKGHIIVTSSLLGKWGFYLRSGYAASKHALHGYYESLRMEVEKEGLYVTLVLPGFTNTEISKHALNSDGRPTNEMDHNQAGGLSPKEVAQRILEGVEKRKFEIAIGGREMKGLLVKRLFPALFEKLLRKQSAK